MQAPCKLVLATTGRATAPLNYTHLSFPSLSLPLAGLATATMAVHGKAFSGGVAAAALTLLFLCCVLSTVQRIEASVNRNSRLRHGYYSKTCPEAETVVRQAISKSYLSDRTIAPALLRLFFHDCFVRGCDASILLDETPSGEAVEKTSMANGVTLNENSLNVLDAIKEILEKKCPGIVSCADILAFATRDAAVMAGLQHYALPGGRKDGRVSLSSEVVLPGPYSPAEEVAEMFAQKGFSRSEMVILSGAHSIGSVHCTTLLFRLYNFTADGNGADPTMEPTFANFIKFQCPLPSGDLMAPVTNSLKVDFDRFSRGKLDNSYYKKLQEGRGLLFSDQALMKDRRTREIVERMAKDADRWAKKFAKAMVKVGGVDVLVDNEGTVRRHCRVPN